MNLHYNYEIIDIKNDIKHLKDKHKDCLDNINNENFNLNSFNIVVKVNYNGKNYPFTISALISLKDFMNIIYSTISLDIKTKIDLNDLKLYYINHSGEKILIVNGNDFSKTLKDKINSFLLESENSVKRQNYMNNEEKKK